MKTLTENIVNIFAENGKTWLDQLPATVSKLGEHWNLTEITPVSNMTYHYVAKAIRASSLPVVLKIGCDRKSLHAEMLALLHFAGNGSVQLIDYHESYNALLLQQAIPGITLKSLYPAQAEYVIDHYLATMQHLHANPLPIQHHFAHIRDWLEAINRIASDQLPSSLLEKACSLKSALVNSLNCNILLHGDLHHDNILKHGTQWIAIDPKGIIGDPEFEVAAFDFIHPGEMNNRNVTELFTSRVELIAAKTGMHTQRIIQWVFIRLILAAAWSIEDKDDPGKYIHLADIIINCLG
jgi:streptomycin 6-kinase